MNIGQSESRSINLLCSLLGYSRQSYYQFQIQKQQEALEHDLVLQKVLSIRSKQRRIGTRKLLVMLQDFMQEHNIRIGRDGLFNLLSANQLLVRKRKRGKPITTFSNHWMHKYPFLIKDISLTAPNQLWVSDITYIYLASGFAYLSLITDAYSRMVIGYYLSISLSVEGCIKALQMALKKIDTSDHLIHHSDRGSQYCCFDYVQLLNEYDIKISMTQSGDPRENPLAERMNGILKEELLEEKYANFSDAENAVDIAINIYNNERPHGSIDMLTPEAAQQMNGEIKKRWKNYYSKRKEARMM